MNSDFIILHCLYGCITTVLDEQFFKLALALDRQRGLGCTSVQSAEEKKPQDQWHQM